MCGERPNRGTGFQPVMNHGQDAHATNRGLAAHGTLKIRKGAYLPHWTMVGRTYAVIFRLADSLPRTVLEAWRSERRNIVEAAEQMRRPLTEAERRRLRELHSEKVERYLDAGYGACWMKDERVAKIIADALRHFDGERYDLLAWCVMPNHVHVVVRPHEGHELSDIVHSWKSFTANEANKALGRAGPFWQEEYYDHLIRDEADFGHWVEYALRNPQMAGLEGWQWVGMKQEGFPVARASSP